MKFLSEIIKRVVKDEKKLLGRWSIERCDKRMAHKIDLSNEDHCGPCGQFILNKSANPEEFKKSR
jgi:hypothetical protein